MALPQPAVALLARAVPAVALPAAAQALQVAPSCRRLLRPPKVPAALVLATATAAAAAAAAAGWAVQQLQGCVHIEQTYPGGEAALDEAVETLRALRRPDHSWRK